MLLEVLLRRLLLLQRHRTHMLLGRIASTTSGTATYAKKLLQETRLLALLQLLLLLLKLLLLHLLMLLVQHLIGHGSKLGIHNGTLALHGLSQMGLQLHRLANPPGYVDVVAGSLVGG